ncbi:MAG TPA: molybdenum cofactor biosynthesis protein MoaE [Bacteroidota bacterium]|nr:molybdenum cofactor biosynthesis protein MoaE [Bacteroidota bacterium]
MIELTDKKIDVDRVIRSVEEPSAGGTSVFIGTTRNHSDGKEVLEMEYQAYNPMALKKMNELAENARSKWKLTKVSIVHRVGRLQIGEASVVIAVSAPHRKEAFEACRFTIDTLKESIPIWKKEFFRDGEAWVGTEERRKLFS